MADASRPLDVSIVSGARPDILDRTLSSFGSRMLKNFRLGRVVANIDMIFGSRTDCSACVDVILAHFPNADIRIPATPSFGEAVKSNWGRTSGDFVLHLEDDWIVAIASDGVLPEATVPVVDLNDIAKIADILLAEAISVERLDSPATVN